MADFEIIMFNVKGSFKKRRKVFNYLKNIPLPMQLLFFKKHILLKEVK